VLCHIVDRAPINRHDWQNVGLFLTDEIMPSELPCFAAIDFETADYGPDSACAVAIVKVVGVEIVAQWQRLIRPPRRSFVFTYLHGIGWKDVAEQPTFGDLWPELVEQLDGVDFLAAHNAGFDRAVMNQCCARANLLPPQLPFRCSMRMARQTWRLYPTKLPDVCRFLGIPLQHHRAESDAEACARIVIAALQAGQLSKRETISGSCLDARPPRRYRSPPR